MESTYKIKFIYNKLDDMVCMVNKIKYEYLINGWKNITLKEAYNLFMNDTQLPETHANAYD